MHQDLLKNNNNRFRFICTLYCRLISIIKFENSKSCKQMGNHKKSPKLMFKVYFDIVKSYIICYSEYHLHYTQRPSKYYLLQLSDFLLNCKLGAKYFSRFFINIDFSDFKYLSFYYKASF